MAEGAGYRADTGGEAVLETTEGDLQPATRERLRQLSQPRLTTPEQHRAMIERGDGALAQVQPRALGRPREWLLVALFPSLPLGLPLWIMSGRLGVSSLFANLLTALIVWVLAFGSLAWRSRRWRQGAAINPGWYLFASGLVEVSGRRVRLWPTAPGRPLAQHATSVRLNLGPRGRLRLFTALPDVRSMEATTRERLEQARSQGDAGTANELDPLYAEHERPIWHPVAEPARLPRESPSRGPWLGAAVLVALLAVLLRAGLQRWNDARGIAHAWQQQDAGALQAYVRAGGQLAELADRGWLELLEARDDDSALLDYLLDPGSLHRPRADEALAERVLRAPGARGWRKIQPMPASVPFSTAQMPLPLDVPAERAAWQRYLVAAPGRRPAIEEQLIRLTLEEAADAGCGGPPPSVPTAQEQAQSSYLPDFYLRRGQRCQSLSDLVAARDLARTPEQTRRVEAALRQHSERRREHRE